jgi:hypothetical protein
MWRNIPFICIEYRLLCSTEKNRPNELLWNKLIQTHSTYNEFTISPSLLESISLVFWTILELSPHVLSLHDHTVDTGRFISQPAYHRLSETNMMNTEQNHLAQPPVSYLPAWSWCSLQSWYLSIALPPIGCLQCACNWTSTGSFETELQVIVAQESPVIFARAWSILEVVEPNSIPHDDLHII